MVFTEIPDNTKVFVDANIFIYHFSNFEKFAESCLRFFQKIEDRKIIGYTSTLVVAEILHRLMIMEATMKFEIPPNKIVKLLKSNPDKISILTEHLDAISWVENLGVTILPLTPSDIRISSDLKFKYKLLTNDSVNLSTMLNNGITVISTNDSDFERIDFITVYKPSA